MRRGLRFAFDARRGRLWVICTSCGHWSLVPLDSRWEALEELEKKARDAATVLSATDQIALLQFGKVQAVRIGPAPVREEAWWRYGTVLRGRRLRHNMVVRTGGTVAATSAFMALTMVGLAMPEVAALKWRSFRSGPGRARQSGEQAAASFERWIRYGTLAWTGQAQCVGCGHTLTRLHFRDRGRALLDPGGSIRISCRQCRGPDGWHTVEGAEGELLLRRLLAYENVAGASDAELSASLEAIRSGSLHRSDTISLKRSPRATLTALELVFTQKFEADALRAQLKDLQDRWHVEEELARIIDRELTP